MKELFLPQLTPSRPSRRVGCPEQKPQGCLAGDFQPKNQITLLFHSHPTSSHSPCSPLSLPTPRPPPDTSACLFCPHILCSQQLSCISCLEMSGSPAGSVLWLGDFFWKRFFYYKPNGSCIQAPNKEAAYWVNSKQLASFRRLYNSGELFTTVLFLTCLRSVKTITSEPKARLIPESSLWKVGCVNCEPLAAKPCYICNTSFGLYSDQWLAHKTLTNVFIS